MVKICNTHIHRVPTWEARERSADCFFLLSWTQKYEYKPMPIIATRIPMMFLIVKGSCSRVYPKARTRQVLRCPSTWYVTGEVLPITMNVLKFTDTDIMHERIMNACMESNYAPHEIIILAPKMFVYIDSQSKEAWKRDRERGSIPRLLRNTCMQTHSFWWGNDLQRGLRQRE